MQIKSLFSFLICLLFILSHALEVIIINIIIYGIMEKQNEFPGIFKLKDLRYL